MHVPSETRSTLPPMGIAFPQPQHLPCPDCGAAVERAHEDEHVCEPERLLDYRMFQLRGEIAGVDDEFATYLESPRGRFAVWLAERDRHREPGRREP
jgi:hypothetical protein